MATIEELLEQARTRLDRVPPERLDDELAAGAILVDIRPVGQRETSGEVPEAVVIERNVLEWRLARSSESRSVDVAPGQRVIVMCQEGYQSSLAAAALLDLGIEGATDLVGGYMAYRDHCLSRDAVSAE